MSVGFPYTVDTSATIKGVAKPPWRLWRMSISDAEKDFAPIVSFTMVVPPDPQNVAYQFRDSDGRLLRIHIDRAEVYENPQSEEA